MMVDARNEGGSLLSYSSEVCLRCERDSSAKWYIKINLSNPAQIRIQPLESLLQIIQLTPRRRSLYPNKRTQLNGTCSIPPDSQQDEQQPVMAHFQRSPPSLRSFEITHAKIQVLKAVSTLKPSIQF